jgi:photosystem II stability/assembly factor-like uncharacterized protein
MSLVLGTEDGVYRTPDVRFDDAERVLDADRVMRVRRFEAAEGTFACSRRGLYRSTDGGRTWTDLAVPREEVYSVLVASGGNRWYAGTHPAHVYLSEDGGGSWHELEAFQELPSRSEWHTPRHRNEAHVRSLCAHADAPDRVVAGVEVGGVHLSEDRGRAWTERREGVQHDVHHLLVDGPKTYVASCGNGLYRTASAGRSWTRLDEGLEHRYFREAMSHDGRLYAAAARGPPGTWSGEAGADGGLFVSADGGDSFRSLPYPGQPEEVVLAWGVADGRPVAGTNEGRVLQGDAGGENWETVGGVPAGIRSVRVV